MALSKELSDTVLEEEKILFEVVRSLEAQLQKTSGDYRHELSRARALTSSIVASSRDEDKHQLASDEAVSHGLSSMKRQGVKDLEKLLETPYFGRMVVEEELPNGKTSLIEFRVGTVANPDCRIIDWRKSPRAKLFYEYREGDEYCEEIQGQERVGRVVLRNKLRFDKGKLVGISCQHGEATFDGTEWRERAFKGGGERSYHRLPDVYSLISKEQFRAITEDASSATLIQGVAGSGKSTVALYRLSWLLHRTDADLRPEEVLVLVRSKVLKQYLLASLPSLDCGGVTVLTFQEWMDRLELGVAPEQCVQEGAGLESVMGVGRVKRTFAVLRRIEEYVQAQADRLEALFVSEGGSFGLTQHRVEELRAAAQKEHRTRYLLPWLELVRSFVSQGGGSEVREFVAKLDGVKKRLELYLEDLIRIFTQTTELLALDDTKLLDQSDVTLCRKSLEEAKNGGAFEQIDRVLLARMMQQKGALLRNRSGQPIQYRHIVVDEVQDFSHTELAVVLDTCDNKKNITLVGDVSQETHSGGAFPGWEKLRAFWGASEGSANYVSLRVSHRSTLPIMKLATSVTGTSVSYGRGGELPILLRCRAEEEGVKEAILWLDNTVFQSPGALAAVVCRTDTEARYVSSLLEPRFGAICRLGTENDFTFEEGIVVTTVANVKGLEFPNVLLWNPSVKAYPDTPLARNLLYIAITRAEENLALVSWESLSSTLPSPNSRFYKLIECEADEEEDNTPDEFAPTWGTTDKDY